MSGCQDDTELLQFWVWDMPQFKSRAVPTVGRIENPVLLLLTVSIVWLSASCIASNSPLDLQATRHRIWQNQIP